MGINHSSPQTSTTNMAIKKSSIQIEKENWILLQKPDVNVTQMGSFAIYKNKVTGEVARQYSLYLDSRKQYDIYMDEFNAWRSQNHWNIIETKYIVSGSQEFSLDQFCSSFYPVKIFVENPVVTLSEIKDIPPSQSFYILLSALVGFQHLFQVFGYFPITQSMVTINEYGIVKVWVNQDLSKNRPLAYLYNNITEEDMQNPTKFIKELIDLVDSNTDYGDLQTSFREHIYQRYDKKRVLTFGNCRKLLLNYGEQLKIDIPDSLMSILDLLFEKTNMSSISHQQHIMGSQDANQENLYGKNYQVNGYLLNQDGNLQNQQQRASYNNFQFVSSQQEDNNTYNYQPQEEIEPIHQFPQKQLGMIRQGQNFSQKILIQNSSGSESLQRLSQQQWSHKNLHEPTSNNIEMQRLPLINEVQLKQNIRFSQPLPQPQPQYQSLPQSHPYNQPQPQFTKNTPNPSYYNCQQPMYLQHNPYHSMVQRQTFEKQSTIREEAQEDSFLTSYKNSKFQTSRDAKRASNQIRKNHKNVPTHRQTFSSHSDSKVNTQSFENFSPRQIPVRQDHLSMKIIHNHHHANNYQYHVNNQENQSHEKNCQSGEAQLTKRSQKSIQFHTLNETKELDAEIAEDLEKIMAGMKPC